MWGKGDRVLWGRSLFDVGIRRSSFIGDDGRSLVDVGKRRSGLGVERGDLAQLFTLYPVLHKHPQAGKSSLDTKNHGV